MHSRNVACHFILLLLSLFTRWWVLALAQNFKKQYVLPVSVSLLPAFTSFQRPYGYNHVSTRIPQNLIGTPQTHLRHKKLCGFASCKLRATTWGKPRSSLCIRKQFEIAAFISGWSPHHVWPKEVFISSQPTLPKWRCSYTRMKCSDHRNPQAPLEMLSRLLESKKYEVESLLKSHNDPFDLLQTRMSYLQHTSNMKLSEKLKLSADPSKRQCISVVADMKRKSPTNRNPRFRKIMDYKNAGEVTVDMASHGFDVIFVNTDKENWGGDISDLEQSCNEVRKLRRMQRPAIVMKDIIIHPIQIALAIEKKADGVILNSFVLGAELEFLLESCTIMGTEAIVEVHTMAEAHHALDLGASIIMVNEWDRADGRLMPGRALHIKQAIPSEVISIAAGGIRTAEQVKDFAEAGFDAVVLGRKLKDDDVTQFLDEIKHFKINFSSSFGREESNEGNDKVRENFNEIGCFPPTGVGMLKKNDGKLLDWPKLERQGPPAGMGDSNIITYSDTLKRNEGRGLASADLELGDTASNITASSLHFMNSASTNAGNGALSNVENFFLEASSHFGDAATDQAGHNKSNQILCNDTLDSTIESILEEIFPLI
ncbi:indole-3-glycerol phosphate synthase domain-containing protein [Cardiosporidium cionae]|uniref:indole-3-glycerol-phosphate synthase n=1 Tax=Cardiosporidium cionae TaxID=476202 RepID=A0ABQ7JE18_9APIC|nr:indole-3-glycerol phosphate synthase domain-containing protein [Cardiosporidium cionae]|eukprot:KAF8822214.1 indole-3-glycerol phosphate synthase domain-containing protein [Cardiosporidium cionae]